MKEWSQQGNSSNKHPLFNLILDEEINYRTEKLENLEEK